MLAMAAISLMLSALVFVQKIAGVSDIASLVVLLLIATSYFTGRRACVRLLAGAFRSHSLVGPAE